jgi:hypothetical protein
MTADKRPTTKDKRLHPSSFVLRLPNVFDPRVQLCYNCQRKNRDPIVQENFR